MSDMPVTGTDRRKFLLGGLVGLATVAGSQPVRLPAAPVRRGNSRIWQPIVDLHFEDDSGVAQWWVPELVLLGNTDVSLRAEGAVAWQSQGTSRWFDHVNPDGKIRMATRITPIDTGWVASMTVENRSKTDWSNVVTPVCLLLRAAPGFADSDWSRTVYRSDGKFLRYKGRSTPSGRPVFRMSLVKGRQQIERTPRHVRKWGFTRRNSDDGIIGVVSKDGESVITTSWTQVHHLQANQKATFACVHGNPWLGNIPAGESRTVHGCVVLTAGSPEAAWKNTRAVLASLKK
jgi:hypothetical protein